MKLPVEKQKISPAIKASYQAIKKLIKYSFYIFLLYFAFKGFMA